MQHTGTDNSTLATTITPQPSVISRPKSSSPSAFSTQSDHQPQLQHLHPQSPLFKISSTVQDPRTPLSAKYQSSPQVEPLTPFNTSTVTLPTPPNSLTKIQQQQQQELSGTLQTDMAEIRSPAFMSHFPDQEPSIRPVSMGSPPSLDHPLAIPIHVKAKSEGRSVHSGDAGSVSPLSSGSSDHASQTC